MSKKSIAKNYIYNLTYQILTIILPLITTPYLSRVLGAEAIGIYSYTLSITTYFVLFGSLGISTYAQREIAYIQDDKKARSKVFFEIIITRFITLTISLAIFYIAFCSNGEYSTYYKIFLLEIVATMLDISWFFQGLEEFKKTVIRNIIVKIISAIFIFAFVKDTSDLNIYILIYVLSTFIGNISLWAYLPKYICKVNIRSLTLKKHLKPITSLFIPQIATQIYTVLDKTMLGSMIEDKSETGFYEQAQKIVKVLLTLVTSLGTVMLPRIANTFAKNDKEQLKKYIRNSFNFVFFLGIPIMLGIFLISDRFVPIFYGQGYEKVSTLIKVIVPIVLAIGLSNVIGTQYLLPTKRQKQYTISVIAGAVVNLIMNAILIPNFMSIGASIATVVAEITVLLVQMYLTRKEMDFKDIFKISKNYILAGIVMTLLCLGVDKIIVNDILAIICQVGVGVISYFTILLLLKDKYVLDFMQKFKAKFARSSE